MRDAIRQLLSALQGLRALVIGECGASTYECIDGESADEAIASAKAILVVPSAAEAQEPLIDHDRLVNQALAISLLLADAGIAAMPLPDGVKGTDSSTRRTRGGYDQIIRAVTRVVR